MKSTDLLIKTRCLTNLMKRVLRGLRAVEQRAGGYLYFIGICYSIENGISSIHQLIFPQFWEGLAVNLILFIIVPLVGYIGLWILGSVLFLVYFKLFRIALDLKNVVSMLQRIPSPLAIATVPLCSFISFFITTKMILAHESLALDTTTLLQIGIVSFFVTIILDIMITVIGEKINIMVFPINLMYLFAWLVIIPAVVIAGR